MDGEGCRRYPESHSSGVGRGSRVDTNASPEADFRVQQHRHTYTLRMRNANVRRRAMFRLLVCRPQKVGLGSAKALEI